MSDDLTHVCVTQNALVAFIELITCAGCTDIRVNQADVGWQVTYKTIFTREIKACDDEPYVSPYSCRSCKGCVNIGMCAAEKDLWEYCGGATYAGKLYTPQMIAEADCEGDKAKCGDACHAKSKQKDD